MACIDIGSNTTRLLVSDVEDGRLRPVVTKRAFTRVGARTRERQIAADAVADVVAACEQWHAVAAEHGAREPVIVATAAVREAANGHELCAAVTQRCGRPVRVLSGVEEAALSFSGACHALDRPGTTVAMVDVGGGSTEVAVGRAGEAPGWSASLPLGSSSLRELHLPFDPPSPSALGDAKRHVLEHLAALSPPPADVAVAVGGTASALLAVGGPELDGRTLDAGLRRACGAPAREVAGALGLPPERAALLPAGITILAALADRLGPLCVVNGGLREGVALELAARE